MKIAEYTWMGSPDVMAGDLMSPPQSLQPDTWHFPHDYAQSKKVDVLQMKANCSDFGNCCSAIGSIAICVLWDFPCVNAGISYLRVLGNRQTISSTFFCHNFSMPKGSLTPKYWKNWKHFGKESNVHQSNCYRESLALYLLALVKRDGTHFSLRINDLPLHGIVLAHGAGGIGNKWVRKNRVQEKRC